MQVIVAKRNSLFQRILWTGFLVGLLDMMAAMIVYIVTAHKNPLNILSFIASGLFGKSAFNGTASMLICGALFHFLISYFFTVLFFFSYGQLAFLRKNKIATAILYGVFVWCIMNLVVVPLSSAPQLPFNFLSAFRGLLILIGAIGFPLSFIASRNYAVTGYIL